MAFFFNDTATTEIYTRSLHDALPIFSLRIRCFSFLIFVPFLQETLTISRMFGYFSLKARSSRFIWCSSDLLQDRKSTRLNSSHANISYAVFCLKTTNTTYISRSPSEA